MGKLKHAPPRQDTGIGGACFSLPILLLFHHVFLLENGGRQVNAVGLQPVQTDGPRAGGVETAQHLAPRADAAALELEDVLHLHQVVFHAHHFGDAGGFAGAVGHAGGVHHDVDGAGELLPDDFVGHVLAGHHDHGFETREGVARRIGVHRGHGTVVAGVHGLQHVERFGAAGFAHDDAVGAHTEGVDHQVALGDGAGAFDVGGAGFQAHHVALLQLQLGGVFDGDDALLLRDETRERVQHGGLARAGTARNHDIQPRLHAAAHEIEHAGGERLVLEQVFGRENLLPIAPDGDHRPNERERRNDGADARAVHEACVDNRRGIVDAAAHGRYDAFDDHADVGLVLEPNVGFHQASPALDVDVVETVYHDVGDGGVLEQRLQGAEAKHLVEDFRDEFLALAHGHRERFIEDELLHHRADLHADAVLVQVPELFRGQRIHELVMHLALDFEPAVGPRTGPDDAAATQWNLRNPWRGRSSFRPWPCPQTRGRPGPNRAPVRGWPQTGGSYDFKNS